MNAKTQFSRLGIASFLIGMSIWAFLLMMLALLLFTDVFSSFIDSISQPRSGQIVGGFEGMFEALLLLIFIFGVVPFIGFGLGTILGIAGCIQQKRKRLFAVLGLSLNALYLVLTALYCIAFAVTNWI